jgi:hypothetical protein
MRRRTQLYLDEDQYRWLKRQAQRGTMAGVVRRLIDAARAESPPARKDPLIRYLLDEPAGTGKRATSVTTLDDDVYGP